MKEVSFEWPGCTLGFEPETGTVTIYYANWQFSRVVPNEDDEEHARNLGITAKEHKLAHELAHQLLAIGRGLTSSPITWCVAHHHEPPEDAAEEERDVHALVYKALATPRSEDEYRYDIIERSGIDLQQVVKELRFLLSVAGFESMTRPRITFT